MRILVVGAGGIGGYFGARLAEAGRNVTFLLREKRAESLRKSGLSIRSRHGDIQLDRPHITTRVDGPYDLILVACKAYDLDDTILAVSEGVAAGTTILPVLNGMRHLDVLSARFGSASVLGGHCLISAAINSVGAIDHYSELHHLTFGELDGSQTDRIAAIEREFSGARFTYTATTEIVQEMWEKWVFIASMGCINTLMRATIGDIVEAGGADLAMATYAEACRIGELNGFAPRPEATDRARSILVAPGSALTASLFKDVEAGGRTEADHIVGDLIARGGSAVGQQSLLRIAHTQLRAYEIRRLRELPA